MHNNPAEIMVSRIITRQKSWCLIDGMSVLSRRKKIRNVRMHSAVFYLALYSDKFLTNCACVLSTRSQIQVLSIIFKFCD